MLLSRALLRPGNLTSGRDQQRPAVIPPWLWSMHARRHTSEVRHLNDKGVRGCPVGGVLKPPVGCLLQAAHRGGALICSLVNQDHKKRKENIRGVANTEPQITSEQTRLYSSDDERWLNARPGSSVNTTQIGNAQMIEKRGREGLCAAG